MYIIVITEIITDVITCCYLKYIYKYSVKAFMYTKCSLGSLHRAAKNVKKIVN